ncbi:MAG: hypothetical protein V1808_02855 [Candidatus Daviesbacteria bacterium]
MNLPISLPVFDLNFSNLNKIFVGVLVASVALGGLSGFLLANSNKTSSSKALIPVLQNPPTAQQDSRTFRDFAEGTMQKKPAPKKSNEYTEGTHLLVREGAVPVALTSSVVDLSQYEGKKVKVLGETQKAIKEGWLMDVGKVEVK